MQRRIFLAIMLAFTSALFATAGDWPAFRGPGGDGISSEKNVPVKWSSDQNIRWKAPLPRPGNGSPIVVGGKVFVVCAEDAEGRQRSLYCFDRSDGKQLWAQTVAYDQKATTHKTNPYCGSTPVSDGQRVVAWHSSAGLVCYDLQGKELWKRDLGEFRHIWGYGSSPVLRDGRVFLNCGPSKRNFVTAIDLKTGKTLWETDEPHQGDGNRNENKQYMGSWCTPIIAEVDGKDQVLCAMSTRVNAYDPATGKILWYCEGLRGPKGDLSYSSPVVSNGFCVAIGGYSGPGIGFPLGGKGDVTESRAWLKPKNPQSIGSGVFLGKHVFMVNASGGALQCLEAATGKQLWEDRGAGGAHWGSLLWAEGRLYSTNQAGITVVYKPNPEEFELISENPLGESCNATPAISNGNLFIRAAKHLYCVGE